MGTVDSLRLEAESCYGRGDLQGALDRYRQLLDVRPHDTEVLNDLGTVWFALGAIGESCRCFLRALRINGGHKAARRNLQMACRARGMPVEAMLEEPRQTSAAHTGRSRPAPSEEHRHAGVVCPCCGKHFAKFLPAGWRNKPNRQCPGCGSRERHRALWLYLINRTNLLHDRLRVLHFSPMAVLQDILASLPNLHYISTDLTSRRVTLNMDITDILFKDESIDVVLCVHVLEHVEDDRQAMQEVFRVLKPGGRALIQSPVDRTRQETLADPSVTEPRQRERLFGQHDHIRSYGRDYWQRLRSAGFHVVLDDYIRRLGREVIERHRLGNDLEMCLCTKP